MVEVLLEYKKRFAIASELIWLLIALVISVTAITSVTFLSDRLQQSFSQKAREMIAADTIVRGDQILDDAFANKANALGLRVAKTTIFSTMMQVGKESKLVSLKAVSVGYPLRGNLTVENRNVSIEPGQVWLDPQLAAIYQLKMGDVITLGEKQFVVSNLIIREPDRGAGFMNFAPRAMIHESDLAQTKLLGLGSRASYRLLIAGNENQSLTQSEESIQVFTTWAKSFIEERKMRGVNLENLENGQPIVSYH